MSKFINLPRLRERIAQAAEQICQEEGLEAKVEISIQRKERDSVIIEVIEQLNREPKEVVN